jgi:hypothetical protein
MEAKRYLSWVNVLSKSSTADVSIHTAWLEDSLPDAMKTFKAHRQARTKKIDAENSITQ